MATIIPLASFDVRTYNAAIPGIVQSKARAGKHVHLVEMYSALTTADLADGVRPDAGGYTKMATVWCNALQAVPAASAARRRPPRRPPPVPARGRQPVAGAAPRR